MYNMNDKKCITDKSFFCIELLSELSQTRLYWLWIKYFILYGIDQKWANFEKFSPALAQLSPITDQLSYDVYFLRLMLYLFVLSKKPKSTHKHLKQLVLNDMLWGICNLLSATCLNSDSVHPHANTPGWWGQMNMQILLIYDVWILGRSDNRPNKNQDNNALEKTTLKTYVLNQHNKHLKLQIVRINLIYSIMLAIGFFLFRGFFAKTRTSPTGGAAICIISTCLFNATQWKLRGSSQFNCLGHQVRLLNPLKFHVSMSISIGMDVMFPICVWLTLNTNQTKATISFGLISMCIINLYLKKINFNDSELLIHKYSFFAGQQNDVINKEDRMKIDNFTMNIV